MPPLLESLSDLLHQISSFLGPFLSFPWSTLQVALCTVDIHLSIMPFSSFPDFFLLEEELEGTGEGAEPKPSLNPRRRNKEVNRCHWSPLKKPELLGSSSQMKMSYSFQGKKGR